ncbi:MAG: RHS repeat-associated core domain-containing protein [bacterium]
MLLKSLVISSIIVFITFPSFAQKLQPINDHIDLVDTSNGALKLQYEDIKIPARGQDLDFIRSYNNQSQYSGPLGWNWHFNWNLTLSYRPSETRKTIERVYQDGEGIQDPIQTIEPEIKSTLEKVTIVEATGFLREFKKEDDKFVSIHHDVEVVKRVEGGFVRELKDGTKYYFTTLMERAPMPLPENTQKVMVDKDGKKHITISLFSNSGEREVYKLSKVADRYGNTIYLDYDARHRLIKVSDQADRSLTFTYTSKDKIKTVQDSINRRYAFSYDGKDNLIGVTDPVNRITNLGYDDDHNLISITYPGNASLKIIYDRNNRAINLSGPVDNTTSFSYQATGVGRGLITAITDALGNKTIHSYSPGYYEYGDKKLVIIDPEGKVREKYRDARKNITRYVAADGGSQRCVYDDKNNMTKMVDPKGDEWNYTYEPRFNLVKTITNPNHATNEFAYDVNGNLITVKQADGGVIQIGYNSYGEPVSIINPNNRTTCFEYNSYGNVSAIVDQLSRRTSLEYDAAGKLTKTTNAKGVSTEFTYNAVDQIVQIKDGLGNITQYKYDSENLIKIINALNQETNLEYDNADRLVRTIDALNNTTEFTYDKLDNLREVKDALGNRTNYTYNSNKRLTAIADSMGNTTNFEYDSVGNIANIADANGNKTSYVYDKLSRLTEVVDALGGSTRYGYDPMDNLLSVTDANGHIKSYSYNSMNRLRSKSDALRNASGYEYDKAGNLIKRIDANGAVTNYTSDELNRLIKIAYPDSSEVKLGYDEAGNMTGYSNPNISAMLEYDGANRLTRIHHSTYNKEIRYTYDNLSNRKTMTDPNGGITTYNYDNLNRIIGLITPSNQVTSYEYDSLGRKTKMTYPNGVITTYNYDALSQLLSLIHKKPNSQTLASFAYTYDRVGNRLSMTASEGKHEYDYDKIYQLTKVLYPDVTSQSFTYDPAGNRITQLHTPNSTPQTYNYDTADRLTHISHPTSNIAYQYDNNGNMIKKMDGAATTTYQYNYENKLDGIIFPDGRMNAFAYSPLGQRITKIDSSGTSAYLYDGLDILCEYNESGSLRARYTFGMEIDSPISMNRDGADSFYHADGLGSIVSLTNVSGASVASYMYEAFGKVRSKTGSIVNPFMFTGREQDEESGLYYYRARSYDSGVGRFLQTDPIGIAGGVNYYTYVGNNAVNYTDLLGLFRFGKRSLLGWLQIPGLVGSIFSFSPLVPRALSDSIDDYLNTEAVHEHGFFEDECGGNRGFGPEGQFSEKDLTKKGYRYDDKHYDDALMREALKNIKDGKYSLLGPNNKNNCQDWVERLRREYDRLEKEKSGGN